MVSMDAKTRKYLKGLLGGIQYKRACDVVNSLIRQGEDVGEIFVTVTKDNTGSSWYAWLGTDDGQNVFLKIDQR